MAGLPAMQKTLNKHEMATLDVKMAVEANSESVRTLRDSVAFNAEGTKKKLDMIEAVLGDL
jgi:hypothetical protein